MSVLSGTFVLLFQAGREQFYSRISAGNQLYQDLITSHVPETNNSLNKFSLRVRNGKCSPNLTLFTTFIKLKIRVMLDKRNILAIVYT